MAKKLTAKKTQKLVGRPGRGRKVTSVAKGKAGGGGSGKKGR
jgi:hypothetical protein